MVAYLTAHSVEIIFLFVYISYQILGAVKLRARLNQFCPQRASRVPNLVPSLPFLPSLEFMAYPNHVLTNYSSPSSPSSLTSLYSLVPQGRNPGNKQIFICLAPAPKHTSIAKLTNFLL